MDQITEWLFNVQWWVPAAAAVLALAIALFSAARSDKKVVRGLLVLACLAVAWLLGTVLIDTPQEKAADRVRNIVEAFDREDWTTFGSLIDDETRFAGRLRGQQITEAAKATKTLHNITNVSIRTLEEERDDAGIRIIVLVGAEGSESFKVPATRWRFDFNKRSDVWKLEQVEPMPTAQWSVDAVMRMIEGGI